jgi:rRNA maturation RNase YbeY
MIEPKILVNIKTYQRKWPIDRPAIRKFLQQLFNVGARNIQAFRTLSNPELTIVFLNDQQMMTYNRDYRNKNYATDVLSFPVNEAVDGKHYVGDILISLDRTAAQAQTKGHSSKKELRILLLHGVLHLLGYDHETDNGQMNRLERKMQRVLGC